jgi:hypothetical protein
MEQIQVQHEEKIINGEIERVLKAFIRAAECVPQGICEPNAARITVSRYYVTFHSHVGEVTLARDGKTIFAEVRTEGNKIFTADEVFVLKDDRQRVKIYSPRVVINGSVYTTDEFIDFVRRGFWALMRAVGWV